MLIAFDMNGRLIGNPFANTPDHVVMHSHVPTKSPGRWIRVWPEIGSDAEFWAVVDPVVADDCARLERGRDLDHGAVLLKRPHVGTEVAELNQRSPTALNAFRCAAVIGGNPPVNAIVRTPVPEVPHATTRPVDIVHQHIVNSVVMAFRDERSAVGILKSAIADSVIRAFVPGERCPAVRAASGRPVFHAQHPLGMGIVDQVTVFNGAMMRIHQPERISKEFRAGNGNVAGRAHVKRVIHGPPSDITSRIFSVRRPEKEFLRLRAVIPFPRRIQTIQMTFQVVALAVLVMVVPHVWLVQPRVEIGGVVKDAAAGFVFEHFPRETDPFSDV